MHLLYPVPHPNPKKQGAPTGFYCFPTVEQEERAHDILAVFWLKRAQFHVFCDAEEFTSYKGMVFNALSAKDMFEFTRMKCGLFLSKKKTKQKIHCLDAWINRETQLAMNAIPSKPECLPLPAATYHKLSHKLVESLGNLIALEEVNDPPFPTLTAKQKIALSKRPFDKDPLERLIQLRIDDDKDLAAPAYHGKSIKNEKGEKIDIEPKQWLYWKVLHRAFHGAVPRCPKFRKQFMELRMEKIQPPNWNSKWPLDLDAYCFWDEMESHTRLGFHKGKYRWKLDADAMEVDDSTQFLCLSLGLAVIDYNLIEDVELLHGQYQDEFHDKQPLLDLKNALDKLNAFKEWVQIKLLSESDRLIEYVEGDDGESIFYFI